MLAIAKDKKLVSRDIDKVAFSYLEVLEILLTRY